MLIDKAVNDLLLWAAMTGSSYGVIQGVDASLVNVSGISAAVRSPIRSPLITPDMHLSMALLFPPLTERSFPNEASQSSLLNLAHNHLIL